jgi:coenzyme F420-reducing hydrogenase alpha subunit
MWYAIAAVAVSAVSSIVGGISGDSSEQSALQIQDLGNEYNTLSKQNALLEQSDESVQSGIAHEATTGTKANSASYQAQQASTLNEAQKASKNDEVNLQLENYADSIRSSSATSNAFTSTISSVAGDTGTGIMAYLKFA